MPHASSLGPAAVAVLLLLSWSEAAPSPDPGGPSGAPSDLRAAPVVVPPTAHGLDDMLRPVAPATTVATVRTAATDRARSPLAEAAPAPLWKQLADLTPEQQADAVIELELDAAPGDAALRAATLVPSLWEAGEHETAIAALRSFEESGGRCALAIAWKSAALAPLPGGGGTDVRIGGARTGGAVVSLDFDAGTGHLFSVVRWGSTTGTSAWTVNMSVNGGASWTETHAYVSTAGLVDVSATVVGGYVYVGYVYGGATGELRVRRCLVSTGASDVLYGYETILTAAAATIEEVALASNAEDFDNRVYCTTLQSDGALRFAWDIASDGATFTEVSPAAARAASGLDATWDHGRGSCGPYFYLSYVGADGYVHVLLFEAPGTWTDRAIASATGTHGVTAVSARGDMIICAYEYASTFGNGIRYSISYDCGAGWNHGDLAVPTATVGPYQMPDVDARDGHGTAVVYSVEAGEPDTVYYAARWGYAPGLWNAPFTFNDHDVLTGTPTCIAHLPTLGDNTLSHGAVYFDGSSVPWFDHPGQGTVGVPAVPAALPTRVTLRFAGSNPARDRVRLELAMPAAGPADVRVYDVRGALVRTLARGELAAGVHPLAWDGTGRDGGPAAAGIYFVEARSTLGSATLRVVRLD